MNLDFKGYTALEDLETGRTIKVDTTSSKNLYKERLNKYLADVRSELLNMGVFYELITMGEPLEKALKDFLNRRNKLRG